MPNLKYPPNPNQKNKLMKNDMVYIAKRFFVNHGIPLAFRQIGIGVVVEIQPPTSQALPKALVTFAYHSIFMNNKTLKELLIKDDRANKYPSSTALVEIHPMYLEKLNIIKERHHGKKKTGK